MISLALHGLHLPIAVIQRPLSCSNLALAVCATAIKIKLLREQRKTGSRALDLELSISALSGVDAVEQFDGP